MVDTHISKRFDAELDDLKVRTLGMYDDVKQQLDAVGTVLLSLDRQEAEKVVERDAVINGWEVELDQLVEFMISRRQPQASDLRFMIGTLRVIVDLERMGDEIRSAAKGVRNQKGHFKSEGDAVWQSLVKIHALLVAMMQDMRKIMESLDTSGARSLIARRAVVSDEGKATIKAVQSGLQAQQISVPDGLEMIRIARAFERVAAHLQNIAETVIFEVEGIDVRHETMLQ